MEQVVDRRRARRQVGRSRLIEAPLIGRASTRATAGHGIVDPRAEACWINADGAGAVPAQPVIGEGNVRIGTWNMQGRWTPAHQEVLQDHACDVWLLTEVNQRLEVPGQWR